MTCQRTQLPFTPSLRLAVSVLALALTAQDARADGKRYTARNDTWQTECGACHVAYPPQLLPAPSWRALMSGLDQHFGADAGLDSQSAVEIGAFLEKNALPQTTKPSDKPILRITQTRWFKHEHDDVPASQWKDPQVKSPANCIACHAAAEDGDYSERNPRLPR